MADDTYIHALALVHTHLTAASHLLHCLRLSKTWIKGNKPLGALCVRAFMCVCMRLFEETFTASESMPTKRTLFE